MSAASCTCPGAVCSCGALGIVKDGAGVRVSGLMMDSGANTADAAEQKSIADRDAARAAYVHDLNNAWRQPERSTPISDAINSECQALEDRIFADCIAAGEPEGAARAHAARQAMIHRDTNAWRV